MPVIYYCLLRELAVIWGDSRSTRGSDSSRADTSLCVVSHLCESKEIQASPHLGRVRCMGVDR